MDSVINCLRTHSKLICLYLIEQQVYLKISGGAIVERIDLIIHMHWGFDYK